MSIVSHRDSFLVRTNSFSVGERWSIIITSASGVFGIDDKTNKFKPFAIYHAVSTKISYIIWKFMFADFRVENSLKRLGLAVWIAPNILPYTHTKFPTDICAGLSENYDACFPSPPERHEDETYGILSFEVN